MRFKVTDLDLINTDNWRAVFNIEKGNEAGYFSIRTDPITNEGIIILDKVLPSDAMFNERKHTECVCNPVFCGLNAIHTKIISITTIIKGVGV